MSKHCLPSLFSKSSNLDKSSESLAPRAPLESSSTDPEGEEMERCPNCWKLFPVCELPLHSPICQDSASRKNNLGTVSRAREADSVVNSSSVGRKRPATHLATVDCMDMCPHCLDLFPLELLLSHAETCSMASIGNSGSSGSASGGASVDSVAAVPVSVSRDLSLEQCPYCLELMPIAELIGHCVTCTSDTPSASAGGFSDVETDSVVVKRARYTLEPYESGAASTLFSFGDAGSSLSRAKADLGSTSETDAHGKHTDGGDDLEQCVHCLKEFPISELVSHAASCSAAAGGAGVEVYIVHIV